MSFFRTYWLFLLFVSCIRAETTITFIEDPTPPYINGQIGEIPASGVDIELIQKIFAQIPGYQAEFLPLLPWKRAMNLVETGKADALIHVIKTPEREKNFHFTEAAYRGKSVFFYYANRFPDGFTWSYLDELQAYSLCSMTGMAANEYFGTLNQSGKNFNVHTTQKPEDCIKLMKLGRVDLFIENLLVGTAFLQQANEKENFRYASKILYETDFHMAFSKKNKAYRLIPRINTVLQQMKDKGEVDRLLESYR